MKKKIERCSECGVVLKDRPTTCPLCGADLAAVEQPAAALGADDYHDKMRKLREELRKLQEESEAS